MSKLDKTAPLAFVVLAALAFVAATAFGAETTKSSRTWKTTDGEATNATLIKIFNDRENDDAKSVALRLANGTLVLVPVALLSANDRTFLADFESGKKLSGGDDAPNRSVFNPLDDRSVRVEAAPGRKTAGTPEKFALLIGVDRYENFPPLAQLRYCAKDMALLADVLTKNGFPPENVFTMTTDASSQALAPTKKNIEWQIGALSRLVDADDTIFIAFSGHGVALDGVSYLCPTETPEISTDVDLNDFASKLVSRRWFFDEAKAARARNRILLFDACRNDPFEDVKKKALESGKRSVGLEQIGAVRSLSKAEAGGASFYMMAGCQYGEFSTEAPKLKQGLFTYYLAQGLRGYADKERTTGNADGKVDVKEAFEYANFRVRNYRNPNGYVQKPLDFRSEMDYAPELTLVPARLPTLPKKSGETLRDSETSALFERLANVENALRDGNVTLAESELAVVLKIDPENSLAAGFKERIAKAKTETARKRREKQAPKEKRTQTDDEEISFDPETVQEIFGGSLDSPPSARQFEEEPPSVESQERQRSGSLIEAFFGMTVPEAEISAETAYVNFMAARQFIGAQNYAQARTYAEGGRQELARLASTLIAWQRSDSVEKKGYSKNSGAF